MYFSDYYSVARPGPDEWFDPILNTDTRLFVDPFLIFRDTTVEWQHAHDELIDYFQTAYEQLAQAGNNTRHPRYRRALGMLTFPEPKEFGLGYDEGGNDGTGTGAGLGRMIVEAMVTAIEAGLGDVQHFEEYGLLVPGINRDRISDITCNVLKARFVEYTQRVCAEIDVPMEPFDVPAVEFDPNRYRRVAAKRLLPRNPVTGRPVILLPQRFLSALPTLTVDAWWEYSETTLRDDFNLHIAERVDRQQIIDMARQRVELISDWAATREDIDAKPYDLERDPLGEYQWDRFASRYTAENPLQLFATSDKSDDINTIVRKVVRQFKHFVEEQGGWELLWNDGPNPKPKQERAIQLLFKGVVQYYCSANGVALDREVELGRGPVDFAFTKTRRERVLLEVKKMDNGRFWHGLETQLISYLTSDECHRGWFLAVRFKDTRTEKDRTTLLPSKTRAAAELTGFDLHSDWIDARRPASASKIAARP